MINHPVVYFLSSVSTLKNFNDIYVNRHLKTKIIGMQFYCGTNFFNTLYITLYNVSVKEILNDYVPSRSHRRDKMYMFQRKLFFFFRLLIYSVLPCNN